VFPLPVLFERGPESFILLFFFTFTQAEKAEKEARDLKGTMRKRMEFLDFD
jgi:hypothetical protein